MAVIYTPHFVQFFDDNGDPLSGGKLYTYAAGTTTPKATYTTQAASVENSNPVILDSEGRAIIFIEGSYKFKLTDSSDVPIGPNGGITDNITSFNASTESNTGFFQSFSGDGATVAYTLSENLGEDEKALMIYSELEYSTNGTFATDTGWTKGAGWTIAAGVATATGAISTAIEQSAGITIIHGKAYLVKYTITRSAGTLTPQLGGTDGTGRTASGTYSEVIIAGSTQTIAFNTSGFTGTLDNVSIRDVGVLSIRNPGDYTLNGTALTFVKAPASGTGNIFVFAPYTLIGAAGAAQTAADAAIAAQAAAEAAQVAAELAETNAETAETNAETAETNAETAATSAASSASTATTQASNAAASATTALSAANAGAVQWLFDSSTTMADPGTGDLRFNNATVSSVTAIAVSALSSYSGNPNMRTFIASWDDSTNTNKGTITIRKSGTPATFAQFTVSGSLTDNTTWLQLAVTYVTGNGTFSASDVLYADFARSGDSGGGSGTVTSVATGSGLTGGPITTTGTISLDINGLTTFASIIAPDDDYFPIYINSATANRKTRVSSFFSGSFLGFASESTPDIADRVIMYDNSASSTKYMTLDNMYKSVNALTVDSTPDRSADYLLSYDTSASTAKKVLHKNVGQLVQQVFASDATMTSGTAQIPNDDTIPQSTEGLQAITATITPTNASNYLLITAQINISTSASNEVYIAALFQDSTANALHVSTSYSSVGAELATIFMQYRMVAGTTSATTFKIRAAGEDSSTVTLNGQSAARKFGGVLAHTICIQEITP